MKGSLCSHERQRANKLRSDDVARPQGPAMVSMRRCPPAGGRSPVPRSRFPAFNPQTGFSLLEVIAAILLLAIAFTALMKVAGASMALSHNAAEHSAAAMHARGLLDSAFVGESIKPGSQSGHFDSRYRWTLEVSAWNPGEPAAAATLQLYQLDLTVLWGPAARPRTAHFRTLRLGSPLSRQTAQAMP